MVRDQRKIFFSKFLYNIIEVSIVAYIPMDFKAKRIYIGRVALMKVVTLSFRYRVAKPIINNKATLTAVLTMLAFKDGLHVPK